MKTSAELMTLSGSPEVFCELAPSWGGSDKKKLWPSRGHYPREDGSDNIAAGMPLAVAGATLAGDLPNAGKPPLSPVLASQSDDLIR